MDAMRSANILVVEDDEQVSDVVVYMLEKHGYGVSLAADGKAGLAVFRQGQPDLVVLDLNLPHIPGKELFGMMRRERPDVPVIMLTCQSDDIDRILGLEMGADDYVTKPFHAAELLARVRAVLRRYRRGQVQDVHIIHEGPFWMDVTAHIFRYHGKDVELTRQEFEIIRALAGSPARTYTRDVLITRMYEDGHPVTDRSVDACIKRLRHKLLQACPGDDPIRTMYGVGYKLNEKLL
jgi:two-component system, OmpR family, response regulator BaeR